MSFKEYLEEKTAPKVVTKAEAYWINPYGFIKPVKNRHIHEVFENPEAFDMTMNEIEAIYKKYKEKLYSEGDARTEIIKNLLAKGWIRIRRYNNAWSINVAQLGDEQKEYLYDWAVQMIKNKESRYDDVNIDTRQGVVRMSMDDIAKFNFAESVMPKRKHKLKWVNTF